MIIYIKYKMIENYSRGIYKGKSPTKILNHLSKGKHKKNYKEMQKYIRDSPKMSLTIPKEEDNFEDKLSLFSTQKLKNNDSFLTGNFNLDNYSTIISPKLTTRNEHEYNKDKIDNNNILNKFREHKNKIKMKFYCLISLIYFSLNFLSIKILYSLPIYKIPPLGTSLFMISFNNVILSVFFINLDQINYHDYFDIEIVIDNFIKMILHFFSILLTIKSLKKVSLLNFVLIVNMNPIVISFLNIWENNKRYTSKDSICYFLFMLISIVEFFTNNKVSIICVFLLISIKVFSKRKLNRIKNFHPYITIFGISLIGISLSPIIMVLNRDLLMISFSQYLFFAIISLTLFFNFYFSSKHAHYSFGKVFQLIISILYFLLFIIYSTILLREENYSYTYIFIVFSYIIGIYAIFRLDSKNI